MYKDQKYKQDHWVVYRLKEIDDHQIYYWDYPNEYIWHKEHRFSKAYDKLLIKRRIAKDLDPMTGKNLYRSGMTLLAGCNLAGGFDG